MGFYVTFQPRWVFEGITGDTKAGQAARRVIRKHLRNYDRDRSLPASWATTATRDNREWMQYFIPDRNETELTGARSTSPRPARRARDRRGEQRMTTASPYRARRCRWDWSSAVEHLLPPNKTNSIEVQYDLPNREHTDAPAPRPTRRCWSSRARSPSAGATGRAHAARATGSCCRSARCTRRSPATTAACT